MSRRCFWLYQHAQRGNVIHLEILSTAETTDKLLNAVSKSAGWEITSILILGTNNTKTNSLV